MYIQEMVLSNGNNWPLLDIEIRKMYYMKYQEIFT